MAILEERLGSQTLVLSTPWGSHPTGLWGRWWIREKETAEKMPVLM